MYLYLSLQFIYTKFRIFTALAEKNVLKTDDKSCTTQNTDSKAVTLYSPSFPIPPLPVRSVFSVYCFLRLL